jgi:hypothetical protein
VPLLLIPLLVLGVVALWALLLPLSIIQRYRYGRQRRRAQPLAVRINAWLLLVSAPLFVASAWMSGYWIEGAVLHALCGLGAGVVVGIVGLWITRFEPGPHRSGPQGLFYTPPAALVLVLSVLVAARVLLGLWQLLQRWHAVEAAPPGALADHASLFAVGGLLLGYALAYAWGLRRRLRVA